MIPPSWRLCECGSKQDVEHVDGRWLCFACRLGALDTSKRPHVVVRHSRFSPADLDNFVSRGRNAQAAVDALTRRGK